MAAPHLPLLSLNLPSTRVSVDFSSFNIDFSSISSSAPGRCSDSTPVNKPLPPLHESTERRFYPHEKLLQGDPARSALTSTQSDGVAWANATLNQSSAFATNPGTYNLSDIGSGASTSSTPSTIFYSVVSRARSTRSRSPSPCSTRSTRPLLSPSEDGPSLTSLPSPLLEHILSFALELPLTISVRPTSTAHLQPRHDFEAEDSTDLQQLLSHPILLVSHAVRDAALTTLYRKGEFVIDLSSVHHTQTSPAINYNRTQIPLFWHEAPKAVKETLRRLERLRIRLPVPSTDELEAYINGDDGQVGGCWRIRNLRKGQESASEIQHCVTMIANLIMGIGGERMRAPGFAQSLAVIRRAWPVKKEPGRAIEYSNIYGQFNPNTENGASGTRKPLKRFTIILVKRTPRTLVLPDTLELIKTLKYIPVSGITRYYLELGDHRTLWATRIKDKWQNMEPSGIRLLQDLQALTTAENSRAELKYIRRGEISQRSLSDPARRLQIERSGGAIRGVRDRGPASVTMSIQNILGETSSQKGSHKKGYSPGCIAAPGLPKFGSSQREPPTIEELKTKGISARAPAPVTMSVQNLCGDSPLEKKSPKKNDTFNCIAAPGIPKFGSRAPSPPSEREPPTIEELKRIAEAIKNGFY